MRAVEHQLDTTNLKMNNIVFVSVYSSMFFIVSKVKYFFTYQPVQRGLSLANIFLRKENYCRQLNKGIIVVITILLISILGANPCIRASVTNLEPISTAWGTYENNPSPFTGNVHLDSAVECNGLISIRIDNSPLGTNLARECDGQWTAVKPGDHIRFTCWFKIDKSSLGDKNPQSGARIGFDYYDNKGRITGIQYSGPYTTAYTESQLASEYVQWGTSDWVQRTIDTTVPPVVFSDTDGSTHIPTGIIPTMQVWSIIYGPSDSGAAWFANPIVTIESNITGTTGTIPIDFNNDSLINFYDTVYFVIAYQQYHLMNVLNPRCDLNQDGTIDFSDLIIFARDYMAYNG